MLLLIIGTAKAQDLQVQDADKVTEKKILILGDSLTSGYGLLPGQGFVPVLQNRLVEQGYEVSLIDAGVAGDTISAALERLPWLLEEQQLTGVIVALGANDMLRGVLPSISKKNLEAILAILAEKEIPALLVGMKANASMGSAYAEEFEQMYEEVAQAHAVPLYPFFLQDIAGVHALNQPDGIHPNRNGVVLMVSNIMPTITDFLEEIISEAPSVQPTTQDVQN